MEGNDAEKGHQTLSENAEYILVDHIKKIMAAVKCKISESVSEHYKDVVLVWDGFKTAFCCFYHSNQPYPTSQQMAWTWGRTLFHMTNWRRAKWGI